MPRLEMVPIEKIWRDKRYREDLGDIDSLVESIKEKGVLQPITVRDDYLLLAGERRLIAAKKAGLTEIPALVREGEGEVDDREVELLENIVRKDFTWVERVQLVEELHNLCKARQADWSARKTAAILSRSKSEVARELELARALKTIPELREVEVEWEAYKKLKKLEEKAIVKELRSRQESRAAKTGIDTTLRIADSNYRIGDTFDGLASLRANSQIHLIECDPPYGIDLPDVRQQKEGEIERYQEVPKDKYLSFLDKLASELYRVAGRDCWLIFWYGPTWAHEVLTALRKAGWTVDDIPGIWVKERGQTNQPHIYLARSYEPFYIGRKGNPVLAKEGRANVFSYNTVPAQVRYHPTERPVPLLEEILQTFCHPTQIVLVPFLGSGATLRAAYNCGMSAYGWEINPEYKDYFMLKVEEDVRKTYDGSE